MKQQLQTLVLKWLKLATQIQLLKNKPTVIGVTGSAGKSSAVKAIGLVLATKHHVKYTTKGNSETGIPLEILDIPVKNYSQLGWLKVCFQALWSLLFNWVKYDLLVLEMGIDSDQAPKNMGYLLDMVQPQVGVFLNVNNVHGQNFKGRNTLKAIAQEKGKLLQSLPQDGLAVYSKDHDEIVTLAKKLKTNKKTFSLNQKANYQLLRFNADLEKTEYIFLAEGRHQVLRFRKQLHLKEAFGSFAAALMIGQHFSVNLDAAIQALEENYHLLPGRMSLIPGINQSFIIDSSYNSSLEPTTAALELLDQIPARGKKIAILGDMREIGQKEKSDHEELAQVAAKLAKEIILVGPLTKKYMLPILKKKRFAKTRLHWFENAYQAIPTAQKIIDKHDLVLVKGSQNTIFLEIIVKAIMAEPAKAKQLLCRQTSYWELQRKKLEK